MRIDENKMRELAARTSPFSPDALRREENVFFIGGNLPERQTIETLYESHYQSNAALFHLTFGERDRFASGENLARLIKKNFNARLTGRLDFAATPQMIDRAYAAGIDILDIPLHADRRAHAAVEGGDHEERFKALAYARTIFPRWSVVSTLAAAQETPAAIKAGIDVLLEDGIVPLVELSGDAARGAVKDLTQLFGYLQSGWREKKVLVKPLLPLIYLITPLAPASRKGILRGFIDSVEDRRLLATSDLRRLLRVKEVAESFESSGL
ncbi:hypothetical protein E4633_10155 [Geomonas terrae]|uniref:Uncharacterized protein n=1 Tax=Geomonas terrae TaxID=2562681 RepID=A0A4V3NZR0_9BACT|nr:hypothetical protein [Geomonas terrae]TGU72652.1 hypothetical protein E4633_10155 [Geomonas terrae]